MSADFETALGEEVAAIPWLDDEAAQGYFAAIGADSDVGMRELKDVVLLREPLLAPADALAPLGRDRMILRAPVHSDQTYAEWLDRAADLWQDAGTGAGYVNVFVPFGFDSTTVQALSNHEVSGAWDGNEDAFSRVFVFLDSQDGYWKSDGVWEEDPGSGALWEEDEGPDAATWDSSATLGELAYLREQIHAWKGDGAYPTSIAVWLDTDQLPDGYWDSPGGLWEEDPGSGPVWFEDEDCYPLYWTLGNVWGQEAWTAPGSTDVWAEDDDEPMVDLPEEEKWIAFKGEE